MRFICLVLLLDAIGISLVIPVMPALLAELSNLPATRTAQINGLLLFSYALIRFFTAPILGGLSDRYGRRRVLLLALAGYSLDYFIMAAAPSLVFLFIARIFSGMLGATATAATACIVDISAPDDRARRFGIASAITGIGFIAGPILGGALGEYNTRLPFVMAGIVTFLTCLYGYFYFPETHSEKNRRAFEWKRANPIGSFIAISKIKPVFFILLAIFFIYLGNQSYIAIWSFFTITLFNWSPFTISLSIAFYGFCLAIMQGILTGPVVKRIGEKRAAAIGLLGGFLAYLGLSIVNTPFGLFALILVGSFGGFVFPSLQAIMTRHTPENAQGELQGALASAFSVAAIIGPLLLSSLFKSYTDDIGITFPGAPFLAAALSLIIASALIWAGISRLPK